MSALESAITAHLTSHPRVEFTYRELGDSHDHSPDYVGEIVSRIARTMDPALGKINKRRESPRSPMLVSFDPAINKDKFTWKAGDLTPASEPKARPRWR